MLSPTFWDQPKLAQKTIDERNLIKQWSDPAVEVSQRLGDIEAILGEAIELGEEALLEELRQESDSVAALLEELQVKKMLSGELDRSSCFLEINAGAGGTEACDWVAMLSRMYQRWAAKKGWRVEIYDELDGDSAGFKSVTLHFVGDFAYGYAKAEQGVHRLVRISPFDSNARRHTSFASVDITPEIDNEVEVEIRPEEVRVDTFRASGAGGQHVNVTDSAVRITHIPTGIVVSCQSQRSQVQNKEAAFKILRSKLYEQKVIDRQKALGELKGEKMEIGWGSQIRNYVFQPYTLVKDNRTKIESGNVKAVMDGEIDCFVDGYLKQFGGGA